MSLSFQIPWYVFLAAAAVAVAVSFFAYRTTVPPVSRKKRYLLISLRSLGLALLILTLCQPVLNIAHRSTIRPAVAVLVDNSLSMSLTDGAGDREKQLRGIVAGDALKQLSSSAQVSLFTFSPSLHETAKDSFRLNGSTTDIASAFHSLREKSLPGLKAILLLSDGDYNTGENPLDEGGKTGIPVFCAGIGDSTEQRDISVQKVLTNSIAYVQSSVPVDAVIKVSGFENRQLPVSLLEEGKQIAQQIVTLPPSSAEGTAEYPVHFTFTPAEAGTKKYTVRVQPQDGEVTKNNNAKSVFVKVLKNKTRVAVVAGAPNADVSAVVQSLRSDPNIETTVAVQQPTGQFGGHSLAQAAGLSSAECVVLVGFPTEQTSSAAMQALTSGVTEREIPVLFIGSRTIDIPRLKELEPVLPFTSTTDKIEERTVFPSVPTEQQYNILTQSSEGASFDWSKLPPIYSSVGTFKAKPEAVVLATVKLQGVALNAPLIASRSVPHSKSFAVLGYGVWRWRLLASASPETEFFFDPWLSHVVRWLVTREENKQLKVEPLKEIFSQGEPVEFVGQAYNANYEPVNNADIHVEITAMPSRQRFETILRPLDNGRYDGEVESLPESDYSFTAAAKAGGGDLGTSEGRFSVGEQSIEFSDTKMNKPLLQQIAAITGGEYADGKEFDRLVRDLAARPSMKPEEEVTSSESELWNLPSLLSVIVALFGTEWLIRKRSGML